MSFQGELGAGGHIQRFRKLVWGGGQTDTLQSPSPKAKTFGIMLLKLLQPRHQLPETVPDLWSFQRRCARQTWGGRCSIIPFYTWGFWATNLPKVMWGICAEPGIYYPLPKSQAGARCRQVVCWMLQPDSWKVLLHSQWNQWVPQFRIHLFLNCTGRDCMFWQTRARVLSAWWILSPWNIIMPNCLLNLLPSRIPQPSCGVPGSAWESARRLSQSSLAFFFVFV